MLWLKAFHVIAVVAWFAGLFYLPRLYVYHADATDLDRHAALRNHGAPPVRHHDHRRPAGVLFGGLMLIESPGYLQMTWLQVKLLLVALVIAYHVYCYKLMRDFAAQRNTRSAKWFRGFNELPSLLLIAIVILAVVKPG